jgi:hypothetical protein
MPGYQVLWLVIRDLAAPPLKAHGVCAAPSGALEKDRSERNRIMMD